MEKPGRETYWLDIPAGVAGYRRLPFPGFWGRWRFATTARLDLVFQDPVLPVGEVREYCDRQGRVWLVAAGRRLTLAAGYAWDGNTPKRALLPGIWLGTPDFESAILPALGHDAYLQASDADPEIFPLGRACGVYEALARATGFTLLPVYAAAIRCYTRVRPVLSGSAVLLPRVRHVV